MSGDPEPCPTCGALPCDQAQSPDVRFIDQLKAKSGEASVLGEPPYSPITVRSGSLAPTPKTVSREEKGRAIYLAVYGPQGGWWEANETKDFWYDAADRFDALLTTGTP